MESVSTGLSSLDEECTSLDVFRDTKGMTADCNCWLQTWRICCLQILILNMFLGLLAVPLSCNYERKRLRKGMIGQH